MKLPAWVLVIALTALLKAPAVAQVADPVVIYGRVEDAATRQPVEGVRVTSPVGLDVALTDVDGNFALRVREGAPYAVSAERIGYFTQDFQLEGNPLTRKWTLLMELEVVELAAIDAVAETEIEKVLGDLESRRKSYAGAVRAFDRSRLDKGYRGSVYDLVRMNVPRLRECDSRSGLCVPGREWSWMAANKSNDVPVLVCVDSWESWGAAGELSSMDLDAAAMVEIYGFGRGGIRVYTPHYIQKSARDGRNVIAPDPSRC